MLVMFLSSDVSQSKLPENTDASIVCLVPLQLVVVPHLYKYRYILPHLREKNSLTSRLKIRALPEIWRRKKTNFSFSYSPVVTRRWTSWSDFSHSEKWQVGQWADLTLIGLQIGKWLPLSLVKCKNNFVLFFIHPVLGQLRIPYCFDTVWNNEKWLPRLLANDQAVFRIICVIGPPLLAATARCNSSLPPKEHYQRHKGPKALSTLTHSTPLVQSRSMYHFWQFL